MKEGVDYNNLKGRRNSKKIGVENEVGSDGRVNTG